MTRIVYFQRKPGPRAYSIERIFSDVRSRLPSDMTCTIRISRFASRGVLRRAYNIAEAGWHQGEVNHVTGDIHFLALGLPAARTVLTVHDCGMLHRLKGGRRALLKLFWFTWPVARCRVVTAVSETTRRELVELVGVSPEKVRVIPNPVSAEFTRVPADFNATRPTILLLGTAPNKNLERMAVALAGLSCVVELVGNPTPGQSREFTRHGIELRLLGNVNNAAILAAYRRCDLLLFASTHEGFGMPIIEAQATGRPVVTSDCSSMPEAAGGAACLVDPYDPKSIRAGLDRVIRDTAYREELVRCGFQNCMRFTVGKIAAEYATVYRELASTIKK